MTSEKLISARCTPRAESSELAGSCCAGLSAHPMLRWSVTALFGLLAWPALGWSQSTLRTPVADDPQCLERDCPAAPSAFGNNADPTTANTRNQAGTAPRPAEAIPNDPFSDITTNKNELSEHAAPEKQPN